MKALYVGILTNGTTSRMRADSLRKLTPEVDWDALDTDARFRKAHRVAKTIAFRWKAGPLVREINERIINETAGKQYDLVWVDKGVYLWKETIASLRKHSGIMVHFTPDAAFHPNRSRHFIATVAQYDLLVTTKSFELQEYSEIVNTERVMLTTQAYDPELHKPPKSSFEKNRVAVFIGLCEPDRERCIERLLAAKVPVRVGGRGWGKFVKQHAANPGLKFLGQDVFGEQYVFEYASASVGLGLLSKRFPELHTTRTFEIPACGTMLATERTADTVKFFDENEALFFNDYSELATRLNYLIRQSGKVDQITRNGRRRLIADGRDYSSVLSGVLKRLSIIQ